MRGRVAPKQKKACQGAERKAKRDRPYEVMRLSEDDIEARFFSGKDNGKSQVQALPIIVLTLPTGDGAIAAGVRQIGFEE